MFDFLSGTFMRLESSGPSNFCSTCCFPELWIKVSNAPYQLMGVESVRKKKRDGEKKDIRSGLFFADGK